MEHVCLLSRELQNRIPVVGDGDDDSREGSGDGSRSLEFANFDEFASSIEEKHNVIGDYLTRIMEREEALTREMTRFRSSVRYYDTRLAQLNSASNNTSQRLDAIEQLAANSLQQPHTAHPDASAFQAMTSQFLNFTNQLVAMQNYYLKTDNSQDDQLSVWHIQNSHEFTTALANHTARIQNLEESTNVQAARVHRQMRSFQERVDDVHDLLLRQTEKLSNFQVYELERHGDVSLVPILLVCQIYRLLLSKLKILKSSVKYSKYMLMSL